MATISVGNRNANHLAFFVVSKAPLLERTDSRVVERRIAYGFQRLDAFDGAVWPDVAQNKYTQIYAAAEKQSKMLSGLRRSLSEA